MGNLRPHFAGISGNPARILENVEEQAAALNVQLTENLQRENLDPIDEAAFCARYFRARRGDIALDDLLNIFVNLERDPVRVDTEASQAASALVAITGKPSVRYRGSCRC